MSEESRIEQQLQAIIDRTAYDEPPQSRTEAILQSIIDDTEYTAPPESRIESKLLELKEVIDTGEITVEPLNASENGTYTAPSGKAYSPVSVNVSSDIGIVPFGTCSSAADAVAKTVTVTNFPGLVDGATIMVLFENTNTATEPTLNVNNSGAQPIMKTTGSAAGITESDSWPSSGALIFFTYVQNVGWVMSNYTAYSKVLQNNRTLDGDYRLLLSSSANNTAATAAVYKSGNLTFNPSTKALTATDGTLYMKSTNVEMATNPQSTTQSNGQILYTDNNGTRLFQIQHQTLTSGTKHVIFEVFNTDSGGDSVSNRLTMTISRTGATPSFDINGVPVYISTTQPTGNIPIGAIGLGW